MDVRNSKSGFITSSGGLNIRIKASLKWEGFLVIINVYTLLLPLQIRRLIQIYLLQPQVLFSALKQKRSMEGKETDINILEMKSNVYIPSKKINAPLGHL